MKLIQNRKCSYEGGLFVCASLNCHLRICHCFRDRFFFENPAEKSHATVSVFNTKTMLLPMI